LKHLKTFENIEIERIELAENIHTNASIIKEYLYKFDKDKLNSVIDKTIVMLERLKLIDTSSKYNL
jgi:hypothetical protein